MLCSGMARLARIRRPRIAASCHAARQPGPKLFFGEGACALHRDLRPERCRRGGVGVGSYCLMPNHFHLVLVPAPEEGLARALGKPHRRYTGFVNARMRVTGHLFQGRFGSVVMDEPHLIAAARYVALNPVRARLVRRAQDWPWSSRRPPLKGRAHGPATAPPPVHSPP